MKKTTRKAFVEMLKEGLRLAFFAAVAALVAFATDKLSGLDPSSLFVVLGTAVLRLADRYVHENKDVKLSGLAPL